VSLLAERAATTAAELLEVPADQSGLKDQNEMATLTTAAYRLFSEAEDLRSQPNDAGLDAAIEEYQKVLEAEPRFALGYADLSLAYSRKFQIGKDRAFLSVADKNAALALQYNPESSKGALARAVFDLESGNTQQAVDGFAKAMRLDPGNPQILIYKARAYTDVAQPQKAEEVYREITRQRPNYWPAYNDLGSALYRQTKYLEAAAEFAKAAAVAPRVALPLANQGTMYLLLKQDKDAEDAFRRSLDRAPNEFAYSNLGSIVFKQGNYEGAKDFYRKALDLNPRNFRTWRNIADCYAMLGDSRRQMEAYGKAAETLSESLRVNPKPGANWVTLAFCHAKLGRRGDAEADLKAADERGLDQRAQFTKAQTLAVLGREEEALDLVLKCIDQGLSPVDVELALDLKEVRADPRYRRHMAAKENGAGR
jgi:tetratricopeptide (TPR) repeat protein